MKKEVFVKNRERLIKTIEDNSIIILFAGEAKYKTADEKFAFTPNRNFYYLTGIDEEKHTLILSKVNGKITETIYILRPDLLMEKWTGKTIREEEAKALSGIQNVRFLDQFLGDLNSALIEGEVNNLYLDLEKRAYNEEERAPYKFAKEVREKYPYINIKNIYNKVCKLREIKCEEEIHEIQKAIDITTKGVELLMQNCKSGIKEYMLEAYYDFYIKQNGCKDVAFKTIAASGGNATILHYVNNNSEIKDGDLILFDLGAQYNYYNADISRTFPVNGKFNDRQKEVYESVLRVNEEIISMIKPGVSFMDLNNKANDLIGEECIKLGLTDDKEDYRKYYFHSIGHSLGLDTHDVGERWVELEKGMILTVEPGLYIEEEGIGVRIEDDILVTDTGHKILTKDCIKSVEDIEKFMSEK